MNNKLKQWLKKQANTKQITLKITLLCAFLLLTVGCQEPQALDTAETVNPPQPNIAVNHASDAYTILALGDSLTEGLGVNQTENYPALLQQALHQQGYNHVKVINSGLSGETSSGLKNRLDWVLQLKPNLTLLNIGANDAMRGLPLQLTANNISEIIERIQSSGSEVVLAGMQIYDNLGQEYVTGFKDMYPKLAAQHEIGMIPFFLNHVAGDPELNQADMIHPTASGYAVIVEHNVLPAVLPWLKKPNP